ncbi:non-ribosomal peptide synthase/polyketide synthase [Dictyobacter arantiisoli]|uniref:Carrier domain-containing protein n=1 Tax=Dictyobacter arantiisoli TaxID=2014874 RepID=A0A5A5T796_9CHLR|nr:non-ribosomal peptide synthase/polyketide synthase [Dictyobacter arantiisoli]GCF07282.1 hypothetical protein KDI_08460 [Dictyobacter arantiisoli]
MEVSVRGSRLSLQQTRLWPFSQENQNAYLVQGLISLPGSLQLPRLRRALQQLIERHEILHTVFRSLPGMDFPMQIVGDSRFCWQQTEIREPVEVSAQQAYIQCLLPALQQPIDLEQGPLLSIHLFHFVETAIFYLVVSIPALCADAASLHVFTAELAREYQACVAENDTSAEEPLQYADVAAWQNELFEEDEAEDACSFWQHVQLSALETFNLPARRSAQTQSNSSFSPQAYALPFPPALYTELQAIARHLDVTTENILLAGWQFFLARLTSQEELVTGVAYTGRSYEELQGALGLYTRVLPFTTFVDPTSTFSQLIRQVALTAVEVEQRQLYFSWDRLNRDGQRVTFPTHFAYLPRVQNVQDFELIDSIASHSEPFVLKLEVVEQQFAVQLKFHFDVNAYTVQHVEQLALSFLTLLHNALTQQDVEVQQLALLSPQEELKMLQQFSGPRTDEGNRTLIDLFEEQVKLHPAWPALTSKHGTLTYGEVNAWANCLASDLQKRGVAPNVLVGLYASRSLETLVGLLAILKAGGAYVALDPQLPAQRLAFQINDTAVKVIVTELSSQDLFVDFQADILPVEAYQPGLNASVSENLHVALNPTDLAYVIYTSGSTGTPKGVLIQHQSVSNYIQSLQQRLNWQPGWQFATVSTLAADLGNTVIFGSLVSGGCLHILDYETVTSAQLWSQYVRNNPIDVLKIVPSHVHALLSASTAGLEILPRKQLILGGEPLTGTLLACLAECGATCDVINHYGPTETTIGVLVNVLGPVQDGWKQTEKSVLPLGLPLNNTNVAIVNTGGQLVPVGVTGELYIAGAGVAQGYLNQPELTATKFVELSWAQQAPQRFYRTGDLARYGNDGMVEFLGRADSQVKIRGYRVELGEIELALRAHEQVLESVVVVREDFPGEQRLVAYVVLKHASDLESSALVSFVKTQLPAYMVPTSIVILPSLPLTPNGKIDRRRLPEPEEVVSVVTDLYMAPRNSVEEQLADIWSEVLHVKRVGVFDNFFTLGGHSLLATQIISRMRTVMGVEIPILKLFEEPTVAGLAQRVNNLIVQTNGAQEMSSTTAIPVFPRNQVLPLSFAQQRLWFLDQLDPGTIAYNKQIALRLTGTLQISALESSLNEIIRRHESLRTTFDIVAGKAAQIIHETLSIHLPVITVLDATVDQSSEQDETLARLIHECVNQPFDLVKGPLLRVQLFQLAAEEHILVLTMHHIVSDAWSNAIFLFELSNLYTAHIQGGQAELPELPIQYADFAAWQQATLQGGVLEAHLNYWKQQLQNAETLNLPTDRPRPALPSGYARHFPFTFTGELQEKLQSLSRKSGTTLFMTLLTALQVLLARYSGQEDISVGSPIANRNRAEIEGLIGFFVNMLVLRGNLAGNPTFTHLLAQVRETALRAFTHQDLPFEKIVEELQPDRNLSVNPLFQVSFSLQNTPDAELKLPGLLLSAVNTLEATTKVDLELHMWETSDNLQGTLIYNTDLFDLSTIEQFVTQFEVLLNGIVANPDCPIEGLPLLSQSTQETLERWNEANASFPVTLLVQEYVELQAAQRPEALAVHAADAELTYAQLNIRANQLAHFLRAHNVGPESVVGVCLPRSTDMLVTMLAILKAGGAYLPLDPAYPTDRITYMVQDAGAQLVVTNAALAPNVSEQTALVWRLDTQWSELAGYEQENPLVVSDPANLAYLIYTSGSTGRPKGVQITQENLLNLVHWHQQAYMLTPGDRATLLAGVAFDACVWEIWPYLTAGASLFIPDEQTRLSPELLQQWLEEQAITISFLPTPLAEQLLAQDTQKSTLRFLLTGGDALQRRPQANTPFTLVNHYGPTEATVLATAGKVEEQRSDILRVPSIGRAVAHSSVYVLDKHLQKVPIGVVGELYIGGAGVGRGYRGRTDLTAECFVPDPYTQQQFAGRLYRTGDLARFLSDGQIEFQGRLDDQLKVRGFRIEPGEIRAVLAQYPFVEESVVTVAQTPAGQKQIVAYLLVKPETVCDLAGLKDFLAQHLPEYMLPSAFVVLNTLPLTPNGKVDYRALPEPHYTVMDDSFVTASSPIEVALVELWCQVLDVKRVSVHTSFFEMGGHSLLATTLLTRIRQVLHVDMPLRCLFEYPTVAEQARWIQEAGRKYQQSVISPVHERANLPLSFAQQRLWFLDQLEPESAAYNSPIVLRIQGDLHLNMLEESLQTIVQRHESLRTTFAAHNGQAVQNITFEGQLTLTVLDISQKTQQEQAVFVQDTIQQEVQRPFNLATGPMLRAGCIKLAVDEHIFFMTVHHIVWDGWSVGVFEREFFTLYTAKLAGKTCHLPELPVQYADYAFWQRNWLRGEVLENQLAYWRQQLANIQPLDLPTDFPRPLVTSGQGRRQETVLLQALYQRIQNISQQAGVTTYMTLLAAFQVLLSKYCQQQDISVGTPVANRGQSEIEHLIGFFVNTLVMRNDLTGNPGFLELLQRVRETTLNAYAHQDLPFEKLVEVLQPEREQNRSPLFQVMFVYQHAIASQHIPDNLVVTAVENEKCTSKFDLTLSVAEIDHSLNCVLEYSTDLFTEQTIQRFLLHWQILLDSIAQDPEQRIDRISILSAQEQTVLASWNHTASELSSTASVQRLFEQQVSLQPQGIALVYKDRTVTYQELNRQANQVAHYLQVQHQVGPDTLVGISIERSPEFFVAMLGILKAGGAYLSLDPSYPVDRLAFMLHDSQVSVVLSMEQVEKSALLSEATFVNLDSSSHEISSYSLENPVCVTEAWHLAYVIYTSGSTGLPKGVMVEHGNLRNLVQALKPIYNLNSESRVLQYMSLNFDVSIVDIFSSLTSGARLCLVPKDLMIPGEALHELIQKYEVTFGRFPPSILLALTNAHLPLLKTVITGGDRWSVDLLEHWRKQSQVVNEYGPTETTVLCTLSKCGVDTQDITIGTPIANTFAYVLDSALQPVPVGVPGELYIGGAGVSRGYLHRPALTAERFLPDPWNMQAGARMYKTGDLVRYLPTGEIKMLGRTDDQVKIRGFRIELGEIENVLNQHEAVRENVVLVHGESANNKKLVAYLAVESEQVTSQDMRELAQKTLPEYMVPAHFIFLPTLPTMPNGKIDRNALLALAIADEFALTFVAPRTINEEVVLSCWSEVLERDHISVLDNFFSIGGHSLLASQLLSRLRTSFQIEIPLRTLFDAPTIAEQAVVFEQLRRSQMNTVVPALIPVEQRPQHIPLSFEQQRLWFLHHMDSESVAYSLPLVIRLKGAIQVDLLEDALTEIVRRHEGLRTTFSTAHNQPVQRIAPVERFSLPRLTILPQQDLNVEEQALEFMQRELQRPFDLEQGPLFRALLIALSPHEPQEHILVLNMHHIISDGWSVGILVQELTALYMAFNQQGVSPLPELALQYADYALWQRNWFQKEGLQTQVHYWKDKLANLEPLNLPIDYARPAVMTRQGAKQGFVVAPEILVALHRISRQQGATLFMTLLAAFQLLLAHYSQQNDIVVGTVSAHRSQRELESLIGFFVNTLPLRTQLDWEWSFLNLLQSVRETTLDAYAHQDVPFDLMVDAVQATRDLSTSPIFQVLFVLQNAPFSAERISDVEMSVVDIETHTAKFDLSLTLAETNQGLSASFEYSTELFKPETIERLSEHFQQLLTAIVDDPQHAIGRYRLLTQREQDLFNSWQGPELITVPIATLHGGIHSQAQRTPHQTALLSVTESMSYEELERQANQLAHYLRRQGIGTESKVGLCLERGVSLIVGMLAILKAGAAYVPLDPNYPVERLHFIQVDAQMELLLTQTSLQAHIALPSVPVLCSDRDSALWAQEPVTAPVVQVEKANLAYVIYTSGSTGRPKGVMITHASATSFVEWSRQTFTNAELQGVLASTSICFDLSIFEIFVTLSTGGTVILAENALELAEHPYRNQVTLVNTVPSAAAELVRQKAFPASVLTINMAGEALPISVVQQLEQTTAIQHIYNLYGPSEYTTYSTFAQITSTYLTIGRPLSGTQVYVLDAYLQPVPLGVHGELYLSGEGLARGYYGRGELTAERFIPNPFSSQPGARMYRTGDVVRYRADGDLDFIGRVDHQVKIRGFRIELGEIESRLQRHRDVKDVVVTVHEEPNGIKRILAYIVGTDDTDALRCYLQESLPAYMIPSFFLTLEALPLTPNGKVDRKALPTPDQHQERLVRNIIAPRNQEEEILWQLWTQVLSTERPISMDDNFFEIGGDSILSLQIVSRARELGLQLTPRDIFEYQTIAGLATVVASSGSISVNEIEQGPISGNVALTSIQHWFFEQQLVEPNHWNQAFLLNVRSDIQVDLLQQALAHLAIHHDGLRTRVEYRNGHWVQFIAEPEAIEPPLCEKIDVSQYNGEELQHVIELQAQNAQASLNLFQGPVWKAVWFNPGTGQPARLLLVIHHLLVDGVSWRILLEDLQGAYHQLAQNKAVQLPAKTTAFQHWSEQLQSYTQSDEVIKQLPYWLAQTDHEFHRLPIDHDNGANTIASVAHAQYALNKEETRALLQDVPPAFHTQMNDVLLTALALTLLPWSGKRALFVHLESHGREYLQPGMDLSRTVGWFTSLYPLLLDLRAQGATQPLTALKLIKEQLRQVPRSGIGYGALRYLYQPDVRLSVDQQVALEQLRTLPGAQISFNYLGQFDQVIQTDGMFAAASESSGRSQGEHNLRAHLIDVTASIVDGSFAVDWSYCSALHEAETIERLATNFMQRIRQLIVLCQDLQNSGYTPSDFPLAHLTQNQIDRFLGNNRNVESVYPLSPLQQGLLFHSVYEPVGGDHIIQTCFTIEGSLNVDAFVQAWQQVSERHAILRTGFIWDGLQEPLQVVAHTATVPVVCVDWQAHSTDEQQAQLAEYLKADRFQGFTLSQAPLLRLLLCQCAPERYQVVWTYHHLLLDGWSIPLLLTDLFEYYQAVDQQRPPVLGRVRSYQDYILWLQQQDMTAAEAFWREKLRGFVAPTSIAIEKAQPAVQEVRYGKCQLHLSEEVTQGLQSLGRQQQVTLNTLVQGAWAILLSRYSGESDVVFGATVAGRAAAVPDIERMVGLFINTLPVRARFSGTTAVREVLQQLQQYQGEIGPYDYSPLVSVQGWSEIPRATSLFESLFVFENYPVDTSFNESADNQQQLHIQFNHTVEQTNYPLMLEVLPHQQMMFQLSYNRNTFSNEIAEGVLQHLQTILEGILAKPEAVVAELPLLTSTEVEQIVGVLNQTQVPYPLDISLHQLIANHARRYPTTIALICGQTRLTYGQLQERATQLAHRLRTLGVGPDVLVGLYMPRSIEMVIGMLAIFQAGGAYLPFDLATPKGRLETILQDAQPRVLLTYAHLRDQLPISTIPTLCLNPNWQDFAQESTVELPDDADNQRLAYVIYTSGSTGKPKGVMVTQKGMLNHLFIKIEELDITEYDCIAQTASHCFDISVWQIFAGLLSGSQVYILPDEIAHDPENLAMAVAQHHISILEVVPSLLRAMLESIPVQRLNAQLRSLRWLVATGEALPADLCRRWCQNSNLPLINAYGPTECSDDVTHLIIEEPPAAHVSVMPIGKALANTSLYILDEGFQPVPLGVAAQLYISGTGVGRGYLLDPQRTADTFIPDPFSGIPGDRMYRTGDLARFLADGNVEFVGRVDYQVKVRGFRIELGEIEAALQQHVAIRENVVLVREDVPMQQRLVAYIICTNEATAPTVDELKQFLRQFLPDYMVPTAFVVLPIMPLTSNGKIDRRALPAPEEQHTSDNEQNAFAPSPLEELLIQIWRDVLSLKHINVHDNFFELGGHSLLATRLISRVRAEFQIEILLKSLFEAPTVAGMAVKIAQLQRENQHVATPALVPMSRDQAIPLSFAQQRLWFIDQMEPGNPAYTIPLALRLNGELNTEALVRSLQEIVRRHEILRTSFVVQDEQPVQIVHPADIFQVRQVNISELQVTVRDALMRQLALEDAQRPFDLSTGPLFRATLVHCSDPETEFALLLSMHHIVSDGWSMGVLLRELSVLYNAFSNGKPSPLANLPVQYGDVALWERTWLHGDLLNYHLDYWKQQLSGFTPLLLPLDRTRPTVPTNNGATHQFLLPPAVADALHLLSQQEGATLFMALLSVFQIVLQRYSQQDDIVLGTDVAGRTHAEMEDLIGFFINQLVLRADLSGEPTFRELLRQNRNRCLQAYVHQDLPFEKLVEEIRPDRGTNLAPFFQVKFLLQNLPASGAQTLTDINVSVMKPETTNAKLDVILQITPAESGLHGLLTYNTDLFDATTIQRLAEHFNVLVLSILHNADAPISTLEMFTLEEREQQEQEQKQRAQSARKKFKGIKPKTITARID